MPGVKVVERLAFSCCVALTDVECGKLEIIGDDAFYLCQSLRSINLPSAKIVERSAFDNCKALMNVEFGRVGGILSLHLSGTNHHPIER